MANIITRASSILGPDGRPLERQLLQDEEAGATVTGVRSVQSAHPSAGLTPQRLAQLLHDAEQGDATAYLELAEDLEEKFLHYRAVLTKRKLAVAGLEITVEAADDTPEAIRHADLVRDVIGGPEFADVLFDLLDGVGKGYAVCEIIWDLSERQWRPSAIKYRLPQWFQLDRTDGETLRLRVATNPDGADLTPYKYLIHKPRTKSGIPIRAGLARAAAWPFLFHAFGWKDWIQFIEIYGHPIRLGKYRAGASLEDKATLLRAVRNISTDFAAIIPESMMLELIRAEGATANAELYDRLLSRVDQLVSKLVVGATATTDAIAGGHAVGEEHREVEKDIEQADARQLAGTIRRDLVIPLVSFNHGPQQRYPSVRIGRPDAWDIQMMMPEVERFVRLGGRVEASVIRDRLGLPDPPADAELLRPAPSDQGQSQDGDPAGQPATAAARAATTGDPIDDAVADLDWEPVMDPVLRSVEELLADVSSFDELLGRLPDLLKLMPVDQLVSHLGRLGFAARLGGTIDAAGLPRTGEGS